MQQLRSPGQSTTHTTTSPKPIFTGAKSGEGLPEHPKNFLLA